MSTFASVSKQIGAVRPETKSIAEEVYNAAKAAGHEIWYIWGIGKSAEHSTKLALDLMVRNEAAGDWIRNYLWAHRERLRLRHVIWEQHITSTVTQPGKRRKMADRGNPTANHFDHIHVWFFAGTYRPPAPPKPPTPGQPAPLTVDGDLGPKTIARWRQVMGYSAGVNMSEGFVKHLQLFLNRKNNLGLAVDGKFGMRTIRALQNYLKAPVDGVIDKSNSKTVKQLQRRLNTGKF